MGLTARQSEAVLLIRKYRYILLRGGSRSGKTYLVVRTFVRWALQYRGSRFLIVRLFMVDIRASIWKITFPDVLRDLDLHPVADYTTNEQTMEIRFRGGGMIVCGGLADDQRVDKILGTDWSSIYPNECHDIPWSSILKLKTRLSQNVGAPNKFIFDLNPTTTAHWSYTIWFKGLDPETKEPIEDWEKLYGTLKMSPYDNIENLGEDYIKLELETKHGNDRKRFLDGEYSTTSELQIFRPVSYFLEDEFQAWCRKIGWDRVRFVGGLDLGFNDNDAIVILAYCEKEKDVWLIFEHKKNKQGIAALADSIKKSMGFIETYPTPTKDLAIYADPAWKRDLYDLEHMYGIPVRPAYKRDANLAVELLQDEVNDGFLHIRKAGAFDNECEQIIWTRNDSGVILREIDDKAFHPDVMKAVIYAFRFLWVYGGDKRKG
jgi:PBSX family phage terminase large subunit